MQKYIEDIIPRIKKYSQNLDIITMLKSKHWVVLRENSNTKEVYIFRDNKELLISINGLIEKGSWEYLGNNSLLINDHSKVCSLNKLLWRIT